ncbi:hypothetical protein EDD11_001180 [Mortierella claussenii]|nr:hypothetical protein EDD11_001180 [Mortierella claussenii]
MAFHPKRASTTSSSSFAATVNPRRQSSYGYIMVGTGALPSTHTAAIKSSIAAAAAAATGTNASNNSKQHYNPMNKRLSGLQFLSPLQSSSQHRNQSLKAKLARACPTLVHGGALRRRRTLLIMLCTGSMVVMIYLLSILKIDISPSSVFDQSSSSSSPLLLQQRLQRSDGSTLSSLSSSSSSSLSPVKKPISYKNPDGTDMDPKSIFMVRDFGMPLCQKAFSGQEHTLPADIRLERDQLRSQEWGAFSKQDTYAMSLGWKRALKQILPNWKDYSPGWVGQGVVLTAFQDANGRETIFNTLVQIKLIRSISTVPIEVWFESIHDITEEMGEAIATWGAIIRTLDEDASNVSDAIVKNSDEDEETSPAVLNTPISSVHIDLFKAKAGRHLGQLQKAMTIAALINSGFEDMIYFSPSTLPMQSPRAIFEQQDYVQTGTLFWQHPTSFPAGDSPIWRTIQADCDPAVNEQSWSAFALRHRDAWKGLFLTWHWLTSPEHTLYYDRIFGQSGNDLLRLAWMAIRRPYTIIDRMPQAGLVDLSRSKGDGIACNLGSTLYPAPEADVLSNPQKFAQDQAQQQRLFQQSYRYGGHQDFFVENQNVMMVDTAVDSSLSRAGSNDRHLHHALERSLSVHKEPTRLLLTDVYAAGPESRVCLKISRRVKGHHQHE